MHLDVSGASTAISKFLEVKNESLPTASPSPLKRSDALMNLDQPSLGSPVAKRRSLHGIASFGNDFNIFDHAPPPTSQPSFEIHEDAMNHEYQLSGSGPSLFRDQAPPPTPTVTRRASSLRKTTLQQRHGEGRTSWGRRQGEKQLSNMANETASPAAPRNRPRLSLDQYLPPEPRGSPFTAHHPLPHPSMHIFGGPQNHARHPLSRTITQSSSGSSSSLPDESPTHFPVTHITDKPRVPLNFAKSVPIGSQRPSEEDVVSTPAYKSAKPDPNAFASTGLVSKVGRRAAQAAELLKLDASSSTPMPDTPCKKQHYPANTFPPQSSVSGRRSGRPSFAGSPSTPFNSSWKNPPAFPISFGNSERLGGLFKARNAHSRRSSLLSIDGDDTQGADGDFIPPTPTKNLFTKPANSATKPSTTPNGSPSTSRFQPNGLDAQVSDSNSKPLDHLGNLRSPTPTTPHGSGDMVPPDPSRLSISNRHGSHSSLGGVTSSAHPPATPTTQGRMSLSFMGRGDRRFSITSLYDDAETDHDLLSRRFDKAEAIGSGEFSHVFKVTKSSYPPFAPVFATTPGRHTPSSPRPSVRVYVVKKICAPITGPKDRKKRYHEVNVLKALSQCDHVVRYLDSWEENHQLYIQTEYCEEGSLGEFLDNVGKTGRLDDFRIWKIMLELCYGVREIHDHGFLHLDLKPANVFITFEGRLKIGDFGLATTWPVQTSIDGEGDRVYIAPEILRGQYDKPADIFSLGLMMLETACNVGLPDNGSTWVELREGDMRNIPSLTNKNAGSVVRDATGTPIGQDSAISPPATECIPFQFSGNTMTHDASNLFGARSRAELRSPPDFMANAGDPNSLDSIVGWMLHPNPAQRPTAQQLIDTDALRWIALRRHAGATVYEGNFGPEEGPWRNFINQGSVDTEMTDA